jgi:hypothetical protein
MTDPDEFTELDKMELFWQGMYVEATDSGFNGSPTVRTQEVGTVLELINSFRELGRQAALDGAVARTFVKHFEGILLSHQERLQQLIRDAKEDLAVRENHIVRGWLRTDSEDYSALCAMLALAAREKGAE